MKARVKSTGEIVDVRVEYDLREEVVQAFYSNKEDPYEVYEKEELDFDVKEKSFPKDDPDYWTRLEHQAAIAAMGGICGNTSYNESTWESMAEDAILAAHFFVEKLKEKEERK